MSEMKGSAGRGRLVYNALPNRIADRDRARPTRDQPPRSIGDVSRRTFTWAGHKYSQA
jgi:hypothetical protein